MEPLQEDLSPVEILSELLDKIDKQESECLGKVFLRFCWLKAKEINFDHIGQKDFAKRPNYWEYWYKYGTPEQYFLMSREVVMINTPPAPALNIIFNKELIQE